MYKVWKCGNNHNRGDVKITKKKKLFVISLIAVAFLFTFVISYEVSYRIVTKNNKNTASSKVEKINLSDDTVVVLKSKKDSGYITDKIYTVKELKNIYKLKSNITEDDLKNLFGKQDYNISENTQVRLVFNKNSNSFIPNKYYIGEKNGYLAIYKSYDKGELFIENESSDIYVNQKKVDTLDDISKRKIKNFEKYYDTKDEAEEEITEYL